MAHREAIVRFRDVSFAYPGNRLPTLKRVNLDLKQGEFVVITGGNGCGKTTLGKCINALVPYSTGGDFEGEVTVCGKNTLDATTAELASRVGFIFANPEDQLVTSTVMRELSFGLENLGLTREQILERTVKALEALGIEALMSSSVFNLSTGQMQLIAIAAFVVMEPAVLILDDPLSHLNRSMGKTVIKTIRELHSKGTTVVWITQDVTDIFSMAERIVVLDGGEVTFDGTTNDFILQENVLELTAILPQHVELALRLIAAGADKGLMSPSLDDMIKRLHGHLKNRGRDD
jgi:energy-coupling factor transporter ATP-binding protein EcfA2